MSPNPVHRRLFALLSFCTVAAVSCGGEGGRGGTLVISVAAEPDVLFPLTTRSAQAQQIDELLYERLADIGPDLNTVSDAGWLPRLATRWEWSRDSMAVTFHLDPRARWHDSVAVRASDVRFTYSLYADPRLGGSDGAEMVSVVDSLTVGDSVTCTVWFKRRAPERFYTVVYNLVPLPEHLLGKVPHDSMGTSPFTTNPVGDGAYRLVKWESKQRIEVAAVEEFYRGRAKTDRVIWSIVPDGQTAVDRVFNGEADFIYSLSPAQAAEISTHADLRSMHIGGTAYAFILFNTRDGATSKPHPILGDKALRRALTMAIDRKAVVTNAFDSLATVALGPFARAQWSADTTLRQLSFDPSAAAHILDSLGWKARTDGMRSRQGKPLAFSMLVPGSSPSRKRLAVLMQEQWRRVGVQMNIENLDFAAWDARGRSGSFDASFSQLTPAPSPSGLKQNWSTAAISMPNGLNNGHFSDPVLDAHIDSALNAPTVASGRAHYRAAYQLLLDNAPALWLYEPVIVAGINRRVTTGPMRNDAWWASIPNWRVTGKALPRRDSTARNP